jgi:hypothetical protein
MGRSTPSARPPARRVKSVSPERREELRGLCETLLVEFLSADLDLAFTFCDTAMLEAGEPERYARLKIKLSDAIGAIRALHPRVQDAEKRSEIDQRIRELEKRAAAL